MQNVTSTPPLRTPASYGFATVASLGSNLVIAAPSATARIRVLSALLVTTSATTVSFLSAATTISGQFPLGANGGFSLPFSEYGWFETAPGEALNLNLSAGSSTGVSLVYIVLPT